MRKIITSDDVMKILGTGKKNLVLGEEDLLTDIAREVVKRKGIQILLESQKEKEKGNRNLTKAGQEKKPVPEAKRKDKPKKAAFYDLVIKNGTVILPEAGKIQVNVAVKDGKIGALTTQQVEAVEEIDAQGLYVIPGIIDPHTHLGLSAPLEVELETESRSAVLGGVTTAGSFYNHTGSYLPTLDNLEEKTAEYSRIDLIPHLTLRDDIQLGEVEEYAGRGVQSYKMYMCGIPGMFPHQEDGFILKAMERLAKLPRKPVVCIHGENTSIVDYSETEERLQENTTLKEWGETHPEIAESEAVKRAAYLGNQAGIPTYLVHVSCKGSIEELKKEKGRDLYVETTSPYLTIDTDSDIGVLGKMLPPFRSPESREALWEGLKAGLIDTIGTDNVTMTREEKQVDLGMEKALPGYPALGTHLPSVLNEGVVKRGIPIEKIIPLMTMNPAKIFGVYPQKGTLLPGSDADIVLVDMDCQKTVNPGMVGSRSDFSLYENKTLKGWPRATIKGGHILAWDGRITDDVYRGKVLKR